MPKSIIGADLALLCQPPPKGAGCFAIGGRDIQRLASYRPDMRYRLTTLCILLVAIGWAVWFWLYLPRSSQILHAEAPQETVKDIRDLETEDFSAPVLPTPDLSFVPESRCDHCALDSCAPKPPAPEYPVITEVAEAYCETEFFLNADGQPYGIIVECSDDAFVPTTMKAIAEMRWPTKDMYGEPCGLIGQTEHPIRYPIEYRIK